VDVIQTKPKNPSLTSSKKTSIPNGKVSLKTLVQNLDSIGGQKVFFSSGEIILMFEDTLIAKVSCSQDVKFWHYTKKESHSNHVIFFNSRP